MAANGAEVKGEGVDGGVGVPGEGYLCPFRSFLGVQEAKKGARNNYLYCSRAVSQGLL